MMEWLLGKRKSGPTPELLEALQSGAHVLDVRSAAEVASTGSATGALNVPLNTVAAWISQTSPNPETAFVVCCRTGRRSGAAAKVLRQHGFAVVNGGSWQDVQQAQQHA